MGMGIGMGIGKGRGMGMGKDMAWGEVGEYGCGTVP